MLYRISTNIPDTERRYSSIIGASYMRVIIMRVSRSRNKHSKSAILCCLLSSITPEHSMVCICPKKISSIMLHTSRDKHYFPAQYSSSTKAVQLMRIVNKYYFSRNRPWSTSTKCRYVQIYRFISSSQCSWIISWHKYRTVCYFLQENWVKAHIAHSFC